MSTVAILGGTGALGAALADQLAWAGHRIIIGSRDPAKASTFAEDLRDRTASSQVNGAGLRDAAAAGDVCILTVPYGSHAETLALIRGELQGKILVDATVPLRPPKVGTVQLPNSGSAAVDAAQIVGPGVRVVSALQTIGAEKLAAGGAIDSDVLVAGDDADAVGVVRGLLGDLGLRSWHVGPLANSAAAEAMTSVLIHLNRRYKLSQAGVRITGHSKARPPTLTVRPVVGLPLFGPADDLVESLCAALAENNEPLRDGDVVVVAQKVISKVEGRAVSLSSVQPRPSAQDLAGQVEKDPAFVELVLSESQEIMRATPGVLIARHRTGHVLANAGIDASNVTSDDPDAVLLWPEAPDASARRLRDGLQARTGARIGVIISDSLGRAWRMGTTGAAIGVAGLRPLRDRRGETDLFGRELKATVVAVADEIAAAASLVIGEAAEGTPVAIVSGATFDADDNATIGELIRPLAQDLFR